MADFITRRISALVNRVNSAIQGRGQNERKVSDDLINAAARLVERAKAAFTPLESNGWDIEQSIYQQPIEVSHEDLNQSEPAPVQELVIEATVPVLETALEPPADEIEEEEPIAETEDSEHDEGVCEITTVVMQAHCVQRSTFRCGMCGSTHFGADMVGARVNAFAAIPNDEMIIAKSVCKHCCDSDDWGWLAGVIKYAGHARANKLERCVKLMESALFGDPEKSDACRMRYLANNDQPARAHKALEILERLTENCSSQPTVEKDERIRQLRNKAELWATEQEAQRLAGKIRHRIEAGNFKRAYNTLNEARKQFPKQTKSWDKLESELKDAQSRTEQEEIIADLRSRIAKAASNDDTETLVALIAHGSKIAPHLDWEQIALQAM